MVCFVSFSVLCVYMCTVLLPPGGYPIAVKYIISYPAETQTVCPVRMPDEWSHPTQLITVLC